MTVCKSSDPLFSSIPISDAKVLVGTQYFDFRGVDSTSNLSTCSNETPKTTISSAKYASDERKRRNKRTLSFVYREICPKPASDTKRTPNEENFRAHIAFIFIDHVRSNNRNDTIPEPIRGNR
jgi:hypothetical protein